MAQPAPARPGGAHLFRCSACPRNAAEWAYDNQDPDELVDGGRWPPVLPRPGPVHALCSACHVWLDNYGPLELVTEHLVDVAELAGLELVGQGGTLRMAGR